MPYNTTCFIDSANYLLPSFTHIAMIFKGEGLRWDTFSWIFPRSAFSLSQPICIRCPCNRISSSFTCFGTRPCTRFVQCDRIKPSSVSTSQLFVPSVIKRYERYTRIEQDFSLFLALIRSKVSWTLSKAVRRLSDTFGILKDILFA